MSFERARAIADAVLFEGYVLYPYRATSARNRFRWVFGVLAPAGWSDAGGSEPARLRTELLAEATGASRVEGRLRFLHVRRRTVEIPAVGGGFQAADAVDVDGNLHLPWEEAEVRELDFAVPLDRATTRTFEVPGGESVEEVRDRAGRLACRLVRRWRPLQLELRSTVEPVAAERPLLRLRLEVENRTPWADLRAPREQVMGASCVGAHLLLAIRQGAFLSMLDPPAWARSAAATCSSERAFPVLAGAPGSRDLVLASPIVLYDHPAVAPESPGDFFDATEIDELLTLRTAHLTEEEKRQVRATDPRAAALLERVEAMRPEVHERLHGALRSLEAGEMVPRRQPIGPGTRVRLRPGARRTDAQDLLYAGRTATVAKVMEDVDDRQWLAVTIDDDPAAELHDWYGRYHHYALDEVELLEEASR